MKVLLLIVVLTNETARPKKRQNSWLKHADELQPKKQDSPSREKAFAFIPSALKPAIASLCFAAIPSIDLQIIRKQIRNGEIQE